MQAPRTLSPDQKHALEATLLTLETIGLKIQVSPFLGSRTQGLCWLMEGGSVRHSWGPDRLEGD